MTRWPELSSDARTYGFHATLKAPFRLVAGMTRDDLFEAIEDMAPRQTTVVLEGLQVSSLALRGSDAAWRSQGNQRSCLSGHERTRRRPGASERGRKQKRLRDPLTERQQAHLERFGYPYVGEDFRFHMTLSGSLPIELLEPVADRS